MIYGNFPQTTRDIDFLSSAENTEAGLKKSFEDLCQIETEDDGLIYDRTSISAAPIKTNDPYPGFGIMFIAYLGSARNPIQADIEFSDQLYPKPQLKPFGTTLKNMEAPRLLVYCVETIISEKLHTILGRGELNSRMKDFLDIGYLANTQTVDKPVLIRAIRTTFKHQ